MFLTIISYVRLYLLKQATSDAHYIDFSFHFHTVMNVRLGRFKNSCFTICDEIETIPASHVFSWFVYSFFTSLTVNPWIFCPTVYCSALSTAELPLDLHEPCKLQTPHSSDLQITLISMTGHFLVNYTTHVKIIPINMMTSSYTDLNNKLTTINILITA